MASEKVEQSDYKHGTPPEGWECLATMDDITIENGNYGMCLYSGDSTLYNAMQYNTVLLLWLFINLVVVVVVVVVMNCATVNTIPTIHSHCHACFTSTLCIIIIIIIILDTSRIPILPITPVVAS
jgi:hypothetical protein